LTESGGEDQKAGGAPGSAPALHASSGTADVFISYASADKAAADSICVALERAGIACWIAPRDVTPGVFYADAIVEAINSSRILIVVLSVNSAGSQHVLREVERASSKRRPLVAFRLDTTPLPTGLEYFLSASHWLDATGGPVDRVLPGLVEAVRRLSGAPQKQPVANAATSTTTASLVRQRPMWGVAALIAVTLLALIAGKFWISKTSTTEVTAPVASTSTISDKSIAVLPFADMSEKKDQEYFADGMAEEILDLLAKLPGIRVIGRTSSLQFKGKTDDLRAIGHTLGAAYLVEGSVRKSGDRLRITAQLIETANGSHVWSETYDEDSGDVLKVQDRIAAGLVRALQVSIGADDLQSPPLKSVEAYNLYLRGRFSFDQLDQEGIENAAGFFQQALELDPTFIRAAEWLADAHESLAETGYVAPREGFERARQSVEHGLALDPKSGELYSLRALIHAIYDWDWVAAQVDARRAIALAPRDAQVLSNASEVYRGLGQLDEAARLSSASLTIDPLNYPAHLFLGRIRLAAGRFSEARAEFRKVKEMNAHTDFTQFNLGWMLLQEGHPEDALVEMRSSGARDEGVALVYHTMGRKSESLAALDKYKKEHADDDALGVAEVYAYVGDKDHAFTWLERAYRQKDIELYLVKVNPMLTSLRGDPRFKAFLRKMNLPE
jgi:TolB-like protein/Tfp pilus assembly protein PilF